MVLYECFYVRSDIFYYHSFIPAGANTMRMKYPKERVFDVLIEQDSAGYYIASVPALPGCHTQAKSLDVLTKRVREAIELCIEVNDIPVVTLRKLL
jgi:predicted RNase H-like HicB family nuclease